MCTRNEWLNNKIIIALDNETVVHS